MNGTERIKALLEGKKTDRVPVAGWLHMPTVDRYVDRFVEATIAFTDKNDWDFIKVMPNGHHFAEAYGGKINFLENPRRWRRSCRPILSWWMHTWRREWIAFSLLPSMPTVIC